MSERVTLGSWRLSSGNACDVHYARDARPTVLVAWDRWPLTAEEQRDYVAHVQRDVIARVLEYREETPRVGLVVTLL